MARVTFLRTVRDARSDLFMPASLPVAIWFAIRHWRWLRSKEGPYNDEAL